MTYYLHRISHHAELAHPLLERGILSVAWSGFATREFISSHGAKQWEDVPRAIEQQWGKMRSRFGLQRFLQMNGMTASSFRVGGPFTCTTSCRMND